MIFTRRTYQACWLILKYPLIRAKLLRKISFTAASSYTPIRGSALAWFESSISHFCKEWSTSRIFFSVLFCSCSIPLTYRVLKISMIFSASVMPTTHKCIITLSLKIQFYSVGIMSAWADIIEQIRTILVVLVCSSFGHIQRTHTFSWQIHHNYIKLGSRRRCDAETRPLDDRSSKCSCPRMHLQHPAAPPRHLQLI